MTGTVFFFDWEVALITWLQSAAGPVLTALASFFTLFGQELVLVAVLAFFYFFFDKQKGKYLGTNMLCALVIGPLVKNIALRRRPYMDDPSIRCLRPVKKGADIYDISLQGYSFPSMHALNTCCAYGSIAAIFRKKAVTVIAAAVTFLVGLSRIFVGVHYPTDILAGWFIGALMLLLVSALQRRLKNPLVILCIFGLLALPGWFYCKSEDFFSSYGLLVGVLGGFSFEEHFVNFTLPKSVLRRLLRTAGALVVFLAVDTLFKLPFPASLLESSALPAFFLRSLRYCIASLAAVGIYPMVFRLTGRIWEK